MIFKDELLNKKISDDGFIVVDFLDKASLNSLLRFSDENNLNKSDGFSNSMNFNDAEVSKRSDQLIKDIFQVRTNELMNGIELIVGSYAVKGRGENGKISIHQDWSITDEKKEQFSYNIWCALEDINFRNGCMAVLVKSHLQPFSIRGSMINNIWSEVNPEDINKYWLKNYKVKYIPLKKGQALIYNQKVVHFSTENLTSKSRLAIGLIVVPKHHGLVHYKFNLDTFIIDKFEINKDFFFLKNILNLNLNTYKLLDRIQLDKTKDFVFDQVKNGFHPDDHGLINNIKKKTYKFFRI